MIKKAIKNEFDFFRIFRINNDDEIQGKNISTDHKLFNSQRRQIKKKTTKMTTKRKACQTEQF